MLQITRNKASRRDPAGGSYRGLDRNIHILFIARIINRFGDFVQMLLVLILTLRMGLDEATAGLIVTCTVLAAGLGQLFGGMVADRIPRKRVMVYCQLAVAACYIGCGLFTDRGHTAVPLLILLSSPFRGATWPVSNALVADFSHGEAERARAFSLLYLGSNIGVAVGPLVAAFLFARNLPLLFWGSAFTMVFSAGILWFSIPDSPSSIPAEYNEPSPEELPVKDSVFQIFAHRPLLLWYMLGFILYNFIYVQHGFALPLQMGALFGEVTGTRGYGFLMTLNAVTVLVMTALLTRWTIHRSRIMNMSLAAWFYVIGFGMYAFADASWLFFLSTFIWTNGEILMATNGNVFVNQHAPASHRGRFNGVVSLVTGMGATVGPYAGGLILLLSSYRMLWLVMVFLAFVIALLFLHMESLDKRLKLRDQRKPIV